MANPVRGLVGGGNSVVAADFFAEGDAVGEVEAPVPMMRDTPSHRRQASVSQQAA